MLLLIDEIKTAYAGYSNSVFPLIFGLAAIVYLLVSAKKEQLQLLWYELAAFFLLTIPGIGNIVLKVNADAGQVWMVYGILAAGAVCGYVAALAYAKGKTRLEKLGVFLLVAVLLQCGIGFYYSGDRIGMISNLTKTGRETVEIADAIRDASIERILAPTEISMEIREYDSDIAVLYGEGLAYTPYVFDQLMVEMDAYSCDGVVVAANYDNYDRFTEVGYLKVLQTENYILYARGD
jgi:hypothetical protein